MARPLDGKVALVTGAGAGIGRACALALAENGATVAVVDTLQPAADETARIAGNGSLGVAFSGTGTDAINGLVADLVARLGAIHILVNASSIAGESRNVLEDDDVDWERVHAVNLLAPRRLIRAVGRHMVARGGGGRIVTISSSSGSRATGTRLAYGVSKAAVNALTRIAAAQLGQHDINVNAVAPGVTVTPLQRGLRDDAAMQQAVSQGALENFFHRVSQPEDVAAAVLFLCLPGSRQITGQVIHTSAGVVV
jgi:NAD(P)-dependent dehydrogenase (short-subunit alcohol dehydrogenase family)